MAISIDNNYLNSDHSRIGYNSSGAEHVSSGGMAAYSRQGSAPAPGTMITGEIVEKDGDQVTIRLGNDTTISAKLQGNANIEVGMKMTFEVAKGADNKMALRPLYSNLANNSTAMSALKAAGLPVNSTTLAMTDKMMSENMPVNRNALAEMFRNVSTHANASPESIVQMTKLNMPLTETNVIQFDNYRNFEHQITNDLQNVSEGIANLFNEAVEGSYNITGDVSQTFGNLSANEVVNEVLNLIDTDSLETIMPDKTNMPETPGQVTGDTVQMQAQSGEAAPAGESAETVTGDTATVVTGSAQTLSAATDTAGVLLDMTDNNTAVMGEGAAVSLNENTQVIGGGNTVTAGIENNALTAEAAGAEEAPANVATTIKSTVDGLISNLKTMFSSDDGQAQTGPVNENLSLTGKEQAQLTGELSDVLRLAGKENAVSQPLDPAQVLKSVRELVKEYNAAANTALSPDDPAFAAKQTITKKLAGLLGSDGFSKLIKDSVKAQMSIKPQDVAGEGKIEELYEKIRSTTGRINEMMQSMARGDSVVAKSAAALNDNVNFMNQLNEFVNYVQLPLKMAGEDANGELYVYTKKKNLADNNGNLSALLHLDMEHLGPMDVYVTMRDYTKVSTNFYLQSEQLLDFMEAHIDELTKRLTEKGYETSTRVSHKKPGEQITPITDEFTREEAGTSAPVAVAKMRFDVRA